MADPSARFDELYRASSRRLLHYAYAMTGDLHTAQDITQEAFVRAWRRWREVETYEHPEAWLRVVVTRLVTDRWRRLRTSRRFAATHGRPETSPPPSEDVVMLVSALRRLPVPQRLAICLHHLLDLPIAQIAAEAGVSENTVKSWLARGRGTLAEILGPDLFADAPGAAETTSPIGRPAIPAMRSATPAATPTACATTSAAASPPVAPLTVAPLTAAPPGRAVKATAGSRRPDAHR